MARPAVDLFLQLQEKVRPLVGVIEPASGRFVPKKKKQKKTLDPAISPPPPRHRHLDHPGAPRADMHMSSTRKRGHPPARLMNACDPRPHSCTTGSTIHHSFSTPLYLHDPTYRSLPTRPGKGGSSVTSPDLEQTGYARPARLYPRMPRTPSTTTRKGGGPSTTFPAWRRRDV